MADIKEYTKTIITSQIERYNKKRWNQGTKLRVFISFPTSFDLIEAKLVDDMDLYSLDYKSKAWDSFKRAINKIVRDELRGIESIGPEASVNFNQYCGCSCPCSPGYDVRNIAETSHLGGAYYVDLHISEDNIAILKEAAAKALAIHAKEVVEASKAIDKKKEAIEEFAAIERPKWQSISHRQYQAYRDSINALRETDRVSKINDELLLVELAKSEFNTAAANKKFEYVVAL